MKQQRTSRNLIKLWRRRDKATIDRVVAANREAKSASPAGHSAFTASGLAIEEQLRKTWRPCPVGLAMF